jgi:hypothetical protein
MFSINLSMPAPVHQILLKYSYITGLCALYCTSESVTIYIWNSFILCNSFSMNPIATTVLPVVKGQAYFYHTGLKHLSGLAEGSIMHLSTTPLVHEHQQDRKSTILWTRKEAGSSASCIYTSWSFIFFPLRVQNKTSILCVPLFIKKKLILLYKLSTFHKKVNHYEQCKTKNPLLPSS